MPESPSVKIRKGAMNKPIASLSCDLDDKWAYMKTHGNPAWKTLPSYLDVVVPRILAHLDGHDLKATFFLVGQDAALERNQDQFRAIAAAGHEIGSHSFHHDPWLHRYDEAGMARELSMAEEHIERATGQRPIGFRGPGYSLSETTVTELARRGYLYDASTLPTFIGPLARAYFFMSSAFTREEADCRSTIFGGLRDGFRRIQPYRWDVGGQGLIEIPVTTMPFFRVPIHFSYVVYLSLYSRMLAEQYFRTSLQLCRLAGVEPSLLLHPLDFLGSHESTGVEFFPGMKLPLAEKLDMIDALLAALSDTFRVVTMRDHATAVAQRTTLPLLTAAM
jgi:hypothetical protein